MSLNQDLDDPKYSRYFKNIYSHILHELGYPVVRVELVPHHLTLCVIKALKKFYDYEAFDYGMCVVSASTGTIDIPEHISTKRIVDVIFETDMDSFSVGSFGDMAQVGWAYQTPSFNDFVQDFEIGKYYMYMQQIQDLKKMLAIDRTWTIVNGKIELFPKADTMMNVGIIYGDIPDLKEAEQESWVCDYALARAKMILGEIREKLASSSGAGGSLALNGSQLKGEGRAETDALEEKLRFRQRPLPLMQF